jgi:CRISPR-associated endoribonuclease Cas6
LPQLHSIVLANMTLKVNRVQTDATGWAGQATFEELGKQAFERPMMQSHTIEFATPTAFHRGGLSVPMPLPELVFGNLVQAWNQFSPVALPVMMNVFVEQCVGVAKHRIATRMMMISGQERQVGFVGSVEFMVMGQEKSGYSEQEYRLCVQSLELLTKYAFYVGVGVRTAVGMGQVRQIEGEMRQER